MRKFERALKISVENLQTFGRLYFTPKQLFYEACRNSRVDLRKYFGKVSNLIQAPKTLPLPIIWNEFDNFLTTYLQRGEIEGLLKIEKEVKFANNFPDDLTLYGLPKILICESNEITQMLRANQFHLQTPCAVLSVHEAKPLSENVKMMMKQAEQPQVFFLHDASLEAYNILQSLRNSLDLAEEIPLRPLGLRPVHAQRLHLFAAQNGPKNFDLLQYTYLSDEEKRWLLEGNSAEVSAVSPVRLLRVLRRLILGLEIPPSEWQITLPKKNLGFM